MTKKLFAELSITSKRSARIWAERFNNIEKVNYSFTNLMIFLCPSIPLISRI